MYKLIVLLESLYVLEFLMFYVKIGIIKITEESCLYGRD